jgi:hypothetical protein
MRKEAELPNFVFEVAAREHATRRSFASVICVETSTVQRYYSGPGG